MIYAPNNRFCTCMTMGARNSGLFFNLIHLSHVFFKLNLIFLAPPSPEKNEIIEDKQTDEQTDMVDKDKENEMLPPVANFVRRGSSNREQTPKGKIGKFCI